jgi:hypothetical protein
MVIRGACALGEKHQARPIGGLPNRGVDDGGDIELIARRSLDQSGALEQRPQPPQPIDLRLHDRRHRAERRNDRRDVCERSVIGNQYARPIGKNAVDVPGIEVQDPQASQPVVHEAKRPVNHAPQASGARVGVAGRKLSHQRQDCVPERGQRKI